MGFGKLIYYILAAILVCAAPASAQIQTVNVTIVNYDFETGGQAADAGYSTSTVPSGWSLESTGTGIFWGIFNPPENRYYGLAGNGTNGTMAGPNVMYLGSMAAGEGFGQTLNYTIQLGETYVFTMAVGARRTFYMRSFTLKIKAGNVTMAERLVAKAEFASQTSSPIQYYGTFSDFSVNTTVTNSSYVGQPLRIAVTAGVPSTFEAEIDLDNARVTALVPVPTSTTPTGVATTTAAIITTVGGTTLPMTPTTTFTRTTATDLIADPACTDFPEVCNRCSVDTLYAIDSLDTAAQKFTNPNQYAFFEQSLAGITTTVFGMPNNSNVIVNTGMYYPPGGSALRQVCFEADDVTNISVSTIFGAGPVGMQIIQGLCTGCLGGLDSIHVDKIVGVQNGSAVTYLRAEGSMETFEIMPGFNITNITIAIIYDVGLPLWPYTASITGQLKIPALGMNTSGLVASLLVSKSNMTVSIDFSQLPLSLYNLVSGIGAKDIVQIPDGSWQQALQTVGKLLNVSGTVCGNIPKVNGSDPNAFCTTQLSVVGSVISKFNISDSFRLNEFIFELDMVWDKKKNFKDFQFALSATLNVSNVWMQVTAQVIIPPKIAPAASNNTLRRREWVLGDDNYGIRPTAPARSTDLVSVGQFGDGTHQPLIPKQYQRFDKRTGATKTLVVTFACSKFPLGLIIRILGAVVIPGSFEFTAGALDKLYIKDFVMQGIYQTGGEYLFRIAGVPSPVPVARFELVAGKIDGQKIGAFALVVASGNLNSINQMISAVGKTGVDFSTIPVSPNAGGPSAFLMLSYKSVTLDPQWAWQTPQLSADTKIDKGIKVAVDVGFPKNCGGDSICTTFKGFLGDARLRVALLIAASQLDFSAQVINLKINKDLTLNKVGFTLSLGTSRKQLSFGGELAVNVSKSGILTFGVEIAAVFVPPKVQLTGYMGGFWQNAFGIPKFALGNVVISIGVTATSPIAGLPMPALVLGAEIAIGPQPCWSGASLPQKFVCANFTDAEKKLIADPKQDIANGGTGSTERMLCENDKTRKYNYQNDGSMCTCRCCQIVPNPPKAACIGGGGYVGLDPAAPSSNWFAIKLKNVFMQAILDVFIDNAPKLPKVIGERGWKDLTLSWSPIKDQEPVPGVVFPRGSYFNGTYLLFGYSVHAEVSVDTIEGIYARVDLDPLKIGDIFVLQRNKTNKNQGPFFYIDAKGLRKYAPVAQGSGYLSVFGGAASVDVGFSVQVPNLFSLYFNAKLFSFKVSVYIYASLNDNGNWGDTAVKAALNVTGLDDIQRFVSNIMSQVSAWLNEGSNKIQAAQDKVNDATNKLDRARRAICADNFCDRTQRTWGCTSFAKIVKCPAKKKCSWWEFWCGIVYVISTLCGWAEQIVEWVCQASNWIVNIIVDAACQAVCFAAKTTLWFAEGVLWGVQGILAGVKWTLRAVSGLVWLVAQSVKLITISSMTTTLDVRTQGLKGGSGKFDYSLVGKLLDKVPFTIAFEIDFSDLLGSAIRLFTQWVKDKLSSFFAASGQRTLQGRSLPPHAGFEFDPLDGEPWPETHERAFRCQSIEEALEDPAVQEWFKGAQIYAAPLHEILPDHDPRENRTVYMDARYLPHGADTLLKAAGEHDGDIKWTSEHLGRDPRLKRRTEMPVVWEKSDLADKVLERLGSTE